MRVLEKIIVASDFSEAPGARDRADGPKSGQEFYEELLLPSFEAAVASNRTLLIDLDGVWGYASSFISGSFGVLAKKFGSEVVKKTLTFKSQDDATLLRTIEEEIRKEGK